MLDDNNLRMKKTILIATTAVVALSACSSYDDTALNANLSEYSTITLSAIDEAKTMEYPISVNAYSTTGTLAKQIELTEAGSTAEMSLQKGSYTIVASSGNNDFTNGYTLERPLMMAAQDITLDKDMTASLTLKYKVARVCVTLGDITDKATTVSVTVGPSYNQLSGKGEPSGSVSPTITCTKNEQGQWTTGTFYMLPSTADNPSLTIKQTTDEGMTNYSINISNAIEAGKTYNFTGTYDDTYAKYKLQLTLSAEDWGETVSKDFTFNDNGTTTTPSEDNPNTPTTPSTGTSLTAGTVWNYHIVALVDGNTATLLSTKEWKLSKATDIPSDLRTYSEDDYSDWRLPTEEEARALYDNYNNKESKLEPFNTVLKNNSLPVFAEKTTVAYLCGDGTSAMSPYAGNTNIITGTSSTSKDYRIRLVKTITINN